MRTYVIGNDGIALCRKVPTKVSDGEIVVMSKEELRAAPLNGKRLLALWNALPGVDKRRKVGDRGALIDQLWSAIERLPDPESEPRGDRKRPSKQDVVIAMLRQPEGATVDEVASVTGWQRHTVRVRIHLPPGESQRTFRSWTAQRPDMRRWIDSCPSRGTPCAAPRRAPQDRRGHPLGAGLRG